MAQRSTIYKRLWKRRAEEGDRNIEYDGLVSSTGRSRSGVGWSGVELLCDGWGLTTK